VAHSEGRFIFQKENEIEYLNNLKENDQLIFRYCHENGQYASGEFPENPNGSLYDIAGICDPTGTILGLMPHPERAYFGWQLPTWTRCETMPLFGDGKIIFDSVAEYLLGKI
jgi:phosphoribosylformylglycinamidine synthase